METSNADSGTKLTREDLDTAIAAAEVYPKGYGQEWFVEIDGREYP